MDSCEHTGREEEEDDVRTEVVVTPDAPVHRWRGGDPGVGPAAVNGKDSRIVRRWKMLTLAVLLLSTAAIAVATYVFTSNNEQREFETQFRNDANKVLGDLGTKLDFSLGAVDALVVNTVSFARHTNQIWPFVTIPDFAVRASKTRAMSNAVFLNVYPLVASEQRRDWEEYASKANYWVDESIEVQSLDDTYHGPIIREYENFEYIHTNDHAANGTSSRGPYLPTWQSSPVIPIYPPYNWDLYSTANTSSVDSVFATQFAIISEPYLLGSDNPAITAEDEVYADWLKDYIDPGEEAMEPVSDFYYPIFDRLDKVRIIDKSYVTDNSSVVGLLALSIYWRDFIKNILAPGSDGIVVVFDNPCSRSFTYELNGPEVTYLGSGDRHEPEFDHLGDSCLLADLSNFSVNDQAYTGVPVNRDYCPMTIRVYPSTHTKANYISNDPIMFTVAVVLIFSFSSAVFLIYDFCVERRNRLVAKTVVESQVNVSQLEKMVKNRTQTLQQTNERLAQANQKLQQASTRQLQHFACMSHEIRTPLNCILGISSLLLDSEIEAQHKESLGMIYASGELLRFIVDDVLDFSKLSSNSYKLEMRRASLQDVLTTVVRSIEWSSSVSTKMLTVRTFYHSEVGEYLTTDHRRLQQILFNLLSNATKFSKESGVVVLRCLYSYSDQNKSRKQLRFIVKDYGRGIAKQHFDVIFTPFNEASLATESSYGGTGLGLSITKTLVEALGGTISFDSVEGRWTEFRVDMPTDDDFAVDMDALSARLRNVFIALVDDDPDQRCQIATTLREYSVNYCDFSCMEDLQTQWRGGQHNGENDSTEILLVRTCCYNELVYNALSHERKTVLLTFGDTSPSPISSRKTYPCLERMLPSVLMKELGDVAAEVRTVWESAASTRIKAHAEAFPHAELPLKLGPNTLEEVHANDYHLLRVLIAEDNLVNQKVLARILSRLNVGYVKIVGNGQEAVDMERCEPFDVILMDLQMPKLDGLGACRQIVARRSDEGHPPAPVIFVTAHVSKDFEKQCRDAGGVDYLSKPCNLKLVDECLSRFLQSRRSEIMT